ncbi:TetR/AcrR family transcriptional regulator [Paenibacillus xylanilyticus]|uniref:TetR/AcrR family transcriptional regulator n=1 Tax=Paenibacillus xylanilyticus TaxID=248903 RepID=UPI00129E3CC7|nr:TetR/AcrR family transcriptional regulator [Paenibacillus xylanilyticus]
MPDKSPKRLPGRPKQADTQISVQQTIILTASKLFMEYGYETVTLQQIGKRCNVSKPTIYYHFASKPELFKVAMITMFQNVRRVTSDFLDQSEHLEDGLIRLAEARLANPHAEVETMIREAEPFLEKNQIQEIREAEARIHDVLASHFQLGIDQQILREDDPMFLAETFSTLMLMGNRENTTQKYESNLALGQRLVGIFLRGAKST